MRTRIVLLGALIVFGFLFPGCESSDNTTIDKTVVIVRLHVTDCTEGYTVYASLINSDDVISGVNGPEYDDGDILG